MARAKRLEILRQLLVGQLLFRGEPVRLCATRQSLQMKLVRTRGDLLVGHGWRLALHALLPPDYTARGAHRIPKATQPECDQLRARWETPERGNLSTQLALDSRIGPPATPDRPRPCAHDTPSITK
jgi:hypothetical protein